jgi:hypothetical protein
MVESSIPVDPKLRCKYGVIRKDSFIAPIRISSDSANRVDHERAAIAYRTAPPLTRWKTRNSL